MAQDKEIKIYEKYPKISSSKFNYENSCRSIGCRFPDFYKVHEGVDNNWEIVGYTLNPPFDSNTKKPIGIMYENTKTFEKVWYHHEPSMFDEEKINKLKIPKFR